jgi:hypothetical protein
MNDDALRALVRETIARMESRPGSGGAPDPSAIQAFGAHPSGYKYDIAPADDRCVIEPAVTCNHCGYCLSHGH